MIDYDRDRDIIQWVTVTVTAPNAAALPEVARQIAADICGGMDYKASADGEVTVLTRVELALDGPRSIATGVEQRWKIALGPPDTFPAVGALVRVTKQITVMRSQFMCEPEPVTLLPESVGLVLKRNRSSLLVDFWSLEPVAEQGIDRRPAMVPWPNDAAEEWTGGGEPEYIRPAGGET